MCSRLSCNPRFGGATGAKCVLTEGVLHAVAVVSLGVIGLYMVAICCLPAYNYMLHAWLYILPIHAADYA